ncbi:CWC16 protein [Bombardia bombarda]|uniref:CWC16 protein n=1 Tax=Bombardia bombarda TaxID=252184 RepID=A0AA39X7X8_9PEZI|nr:CWC16 protein [Bombardia bombarda]
MQGFNMGRYVPPDQEGVVSGNALRKKHALGARASKLASHGILTVRFEMPFAVWCAHCPAPTVIGQGVRFNAEKKRIGSYLTTPVWSFRMRHTACGGEIEIQTDPQNTRYVVAGGGKKRDTGTDDDSLVKSGEEGYVIQTEKERADMRESAFGRLEKTIADRERMAETRQRIEELQDAAERQWEDPYARNRRLRDAFRVGRREREKEAVGTEELRDRMSLGIELLPGTAGDARRAALVDFGSLPDTDDGGGGYTNNDRLAGKALAAPLFAMSPKVHNSDQPAVASATDKRSTLSSKKDYGRTAKKLLKTEIAASKMKENLVSEIVTNTRAAKDPFLLDFGNNIRDISFKRPPSSNVPRIIPGLKRKRIVATEEDTTPDRSPPRAPASTQNDPPPPPPTISRVAAAGTTGLVSYSSDSD